MDKFTDLVFGNKQALSEAKEELHIRLNEYAVLSISEGLTHMPLGASKSLSAQANERATTHKNCAKHHTKMADKLFDTEDNELYSHHDLAAKHHQKAASAFEKAAELGDNMKHSLAVKEFRKAENFGDIARDHEKRNGLKMPSLKESTFKHGADEARENAAWHDECNVHHQNYMSFAGKYDDDDEKHELHNVAAQKHYRAADSFRRAADLFDAGHELRANHHLENAERFADKADEHETMHGLPSLRRKSSKLSEAISDPAKWANPESREGFDKKIAYHREQHEHHTLKQEDYSNRNRNLLSKYHGYAADAHQNAANHYAEAKKGKTDVDHVAIARKFADSADSDERFINKYHKL